MKTELKELYERGYIDSELLNSYISYGEGELASLLNSNLAYERSVAVRLLGEKQNSHLKYASSILTLLTKEKRLYTRLEMTHFLEKGDEKTVIMMLPYLGRIGKNQYDKLPKRPSFKVSYPLPRDIIARTLGNMDGKYLPLLLEVLKKGTLIQKREVLDAIGFMLFYQKNYATKGNLITILDFFGANTDSIMRWKLLILLSAFPFDENKQFLKSYMSRKISKLDYETAKRSLWIIEKREKDERNY